MDANKLTSKQGLRWRCGRHPNVSGDFIQLDGDANDRVLCFNCVKQQKISVQNLILIGQVLAANQHEIIESYPPVKDQELSELIRDVRLEQNLEGISVYFKKLRAYFEREVLAAEQRAKEALIKQDNAYTQLIEQYKKIADVEKLKGLIVSEKKSAEKDLDDFIKEKWRKSEENRKVMTNFILQNEGIMYLSFEEPNRIAKEVIENLKQINFFQQTFQEPQVTLIKSTVGASQSMEINKVDNSIYQIKQVNQYNSGSQVFLDPILDPLKKYILQIEVEENPGYSKNEFYFGLVCDQGKDNGYAYSQNMCYFDQSNYYGLTKIIKGNPLESGRKAMGKHSFEVRIYLNKKYLRVACLPDYSSVAELEDPNKIDPKVAYRFFLCMISKGDIMRIIKIRAVSKFDEKM